MGWIFHYGVPRKLDFSLYSSFPSHESSRSCHPFKRMKCGIDSIHPTFLQKLSWACSLTLSPLLSLSVPKTLLLWSQLSIYFFSQQGAIIMLFPIFYILLTHFIHYCFSCQIPLVGFIHSTSDVHFSSEFQQHNFWHIWLLHKHPV